jgi:hypothetical protein
MSSEKNDFLNILENTITHDIEIEDLEQISKRFNISGYLKSTNSERFFDFVINKKYITKVIFDEEVLNQYLSQKEDQDINCLNGK